MESHQVGQRPRAVDVQAEVDREEQGLFNMEERRRRESNCSLYLLPGKEPWENALLDAAWDGILVLVDEFSWHPIRTDLPHFCRCS